MTQHRRTARPLASCGPTPGTGRFARYLLAVSATCALTAVSGTAQSTEFDGEWRLARFTVADHLPSDEIFQLAESADGRLWTSTARGLAWFDGWIWHEIVQGPAGPPLRGAHSLLPGSGRSMIAVIHSLLFVGDTSGFRKIPVHLGKESLVESAVPIREGILVLTRPHVDSAASLVLVRDGVEEPFAAPAPIGRRNVPALYPSPGGGAWLNTERGLWRWDGGRWTLRFPATDPFVVAFLAEDPGTRAGLVSIRAPHAQSGLWMWEGDGAFRHESSEGDAPVITATFGPGMIVTAYRGGHVRYRLDGVWRSVSAGSGLFLDTHTAYFDRRGDLWVGTGSGLSLYRSGSRLWTSRSHGFPSPRDRVNALVSMPDGGLWAGTGDGIDIIDADGSERHVSTALGRALGAVTGLARDSSGNVWVSSGASFSGAFRWDGQHWMHFGRAEGLAADRIHSISVDRSGGVWFLGLGLDGFTDGPGAFVYEHGRFTRWGPREGLPSGRTYAFAEGPDGTRWFGTLGGLSRWRNGAWTHWTQRRGNVGGMNFKLPFRVFSLAIDPQGRPWFGGGDPADYAYGLGTVDDRDSLRFLGTGDGLLNNVVWQVLADSGGTIWAATESGVSAFRDSLWFNFGTDRGLGHSSVWPLLLRDGILTIGTLGGGIRELRLDDARQPAPRVIIDEAVVDGQRAVVRWSAWAWRGTVPATQVPTRFRVDGGPWSPWSSTRSVSLGSLATGHHEVSVQAKGLFLPVEPVSARVAIRVAPPVLLRPMVALPLATLSVALLVLAIVGVRRKQLTDRERQAAQAALQASEERFATAFRASPLPIAISSFPEGRLLEVNYGFEAITGWSRQECIGRTSLDLGLHPDPGVRDGHFAELERVGRLRNAEFVLQRRDGGRRIVTMSSDVIQLGGQRHVLSAVSDITEHRSLEAQLIQAQKMEAVGQLAGGVAHDFNNLLTAILGHAELLRDGLDNGAARSDVDEIHRAASRAAELTGQLLTFARKQRVEPQVMHLNELVRRTDKMLRRILGEQITVSTRCASGLPAVRVDPGQLEQVLVNLAVNARDAMPSGGALTIETGVAELDAFSAREHPDARPGRYATLTVSDTGDGIAPDVRSRIFEPFFTTKDVGKGTGLGLAICYGIVRQAGGHISVYSEVGRGSTFRVLLPVLDASVAAPAPQPRPSMPIGSETILLVEDEPAVRNLVQRVLRDAGYAVLAAGDGDEALATLASSDRLPDLLLTDVILPGRTGPEIAGVVRNRAPGVAVLYISGYTERAAAQHADIDAPLLAKPFTPLAIAQRVREVLDARAVTAESTPG